MPSAAAAETASPPSTPLHNRRALHVPFFPVNTPPPLQSPSYSPFPKYPSSNAQPFFPQLSSPPPPPPAASSSSSTQTSFPSSVSSLTFPNSRPAPPGHHSSKLLPAVLLPLLAVALLALSLAAFAAHRRRRRRLQSEYKFDARSDSLRLFPSRAAASDGGVATRKHPSPLAASVPTEFFGALVGSRRRTSGSDDEDGPGALDSASGSPYEKLSSPDLRPLPPLARQYRQGRGNADAGGGGSSDEEFYSPRGSSIEKATAGDLASERLSSSRRIMFLPVAVEKCGSRSSTLSTPSYPSSNTTSSPSRLSPAASSPHVEPSSGHWSGRSLKSLSEGSLLGSLKFAAPPPTRSPPPPPPLAPMRPLTPSPPKRKPPSPSPPSSPYEKESDPKVENSDFSCSPSPGPPQRKAPLPSPPPPPPPPPPGYWERRMGKIREVQQQIVTPEKPVEERNFSTLVYPDDLTQTTEAVEKNEETPRPKLKPLHWDKVRASSDRAMVWDQLKSSSFQVNEEMIQTLFVCNTTSTAPEETKKRPVLPSPRQENRVLDPKKSQNIAILLRALNVTKEEVCEALLDGNADSLGTELLETLLKMAPTKEEEIKLKEWKDEQEVKLGTAEKFLKALLDIPFAFKRVDAMLYIANFDSEVNYLKKSFETLEAACEELRSSRLFRKLLEAVLKTGNHMNVGTNRGDAHAFKLDTLLKLVDVKGTDGKTTLLHFVVQEIIRDEGSRLSADRTQGKNMRDDLECKKLTLKVVAGLGNELSNVKKAAAMDADVISSYVSKLAGGIGKISEVLKLNEALASQENVQSFHNSMSAFLKVAEDNIIQVQAQESVSLSLVKEITEYFHGNSAKEEAHPFRIFMVVRDFLTILDQVCKEVGKINYHTIVSSGQHFPVPVNPTLLPVFPRHHALRNNSSDEDSF